MALDEIATSLVDDLAENFGDMDGDSVGRQGGTVAVDAPTDDHGLLVSTLESLPDYGPSSAKAAEPERREKAGEYISSHRILVPSEP